MIEKSRGTERPHRRAARIAPGGEILPQRGT
jgi:hypothetical protein